MKKKITMSADELKEGMLVHPPFWIKAPDRVTAITSLVPKNQGGSVEITAGGETWTVRSDDMVATVEL